MTFDDGILKIYKIENVSPKGDMPNEKLIYKSSSYFEYDDLGITRYYTALAHNQMIESVVKIQYDRDIKALDIAEMEDGLLYRIVMVQHPYDDDGLRYTRLSLERINDEYSIKTENN